MPALPQNPVPNPGKRFAAYPEPDEQSQSPQGQIQPPRTAPPNIKEEPLRCNTRIVIVLFGILHLIFQILVIYAFIARFEGLGYDVEEAKDIRRGIGFNVNEQEAAEKVARVIQRQADGVGELDSREIYPAIGVYSGFNFMAAISFLLCVIFLQAEKVTCSVCYAFGLILNLIITGLYWRIVPGRSDKSLGGRSIVFNSSVIIALIYHICGFAFIYSMFRDTWTGCCPSKRLDVENAIPVEIPSTENPSTTSQAFQQQSTSIPNPPTVIAPSIQQNNRNIYEVV